MKKLLTAITLSLSLTSCAELTSLVKNTLRPNSTMPSYEFYEKFSETSNADILIPLLERNLFSSYYNGSNEEVFKFSSYLVTQENFPWLMSSDMEDSDFYSTVNLFKDKKGNKLTDLMLRFRSTVHLTKSNFYELFNLDSTDIQISQVKQHCTSYRRIGFLYKLNLKNKKTLYLFEYLGSASAYSTTEYSLYRMLPSCRQLGFEKTVKKYGNEDFDR